MLNASLNQLGRAVATVVFAIAGCCAAFAQPPSAGNLSPNGLLPLLSNQPVVNPISPVAPAVYQQPMNMPRQAPLARLVENPDQTQGTPPYALADQTGTIQRYVEPVPGVDLSTHVGQIVTVRHDTGMTLLASQLELPPPELRQMVGDPSERYAMAAGAWRHSAQPASEVQQAQYDDSGDGSVQLLPDDAPMADPTALATSGMMPMDGMPPQGQFPAYAEQIGPPQMGPPMVQPMIAQPYMPTPYPPGMMGYPTEGCEVPPSRARLSADVELMWLRPQIAETSAGKLSEELQFSARVILGLHGAGNFDGRLRYWRYDNASDVLGTDDDIHIKFNVLDLEALHHFAAGKSDITFSAGLRLARIYLTDVADARCSTNLLGLTMAADGMTPLGNYQGGHLGLIYGGRLSILGGKWNTDGASQFIDEQVRNDNVLAHELYGGVEIARQLQAFDVHVRFLYEMQNWHSDALAQDAGLESIGMFGPAVQIGAIY
jgi:hypothetical protein